MGIFSNFKIDSLRKKAKDKYAIQLARVFVLLDESQGNRKVELATIGKVVFKATMFADMLDSLLFKTDSGIFRNNISNLNEYNFNKLNQTLIIGFICLFTLSNSQGEKTQEGEKFCIDSMKTFFGIDPSITKVNYDGLTSLGVASTIFVLYRWCMLTIGYIDSNYETMHENSPDYRKFFEIVISAIKLADKTI